MIKDNQQKFNRLHVVLDALVLIISYAAAFGLLILGNRVYSPHKQVLPAQYYFIMLVWIVPLYLFLYGLCRLYAPKRVQQRRYEFANIFKANIIGTLIIILVLYLLKKHPYFREFSTRMVFYFFVVNVIAEELERNCIRYILHSMRSKGYNQKHILLIGYSRAAEGFIDRIQANPEWGYRVRGILDDNCRTGHEYKGVPVIGTTGDLEAILALNTLDEIAITLSIGEYAKLEKLVAACEKSGVHTKFIPDYNNVIPTQPYIEDLQGLPVINIRYVPLTNPVNSILKRIMDILGACFGIVIASPVMLVCAILVKATSEGPVIFKQERVGLHNKVFRMYKFRTMEVQKQSAEENAWTVKNDPRVTKVGKFMRKTSLDELPQLFNILMGEMSLVGPRPERPQWVDKYKEEIPRYMIKHQVRPGLTGWAQINGYRGDTSIRKRIEYDLFYIENWSLALDIKILFMTIFKGFVNKNAY